MARLGEARYGKVRPGEAGRGKARRGMDDHSPRMVYQFNEELHMKISELEEDKPVYTQLSSTVLAVLLNRPEGWTVFVKDVPGRNHEVEWVSVWARGEVQKEPIARAIAESLFSPGFEIDRPYVE